MNRIRAAEKKRKARLIFPRTYETILDAKAGGIPALDVWNTMKKSLAGREGMSASAFAATLAEYHGYIVEIYQIDGKDLPL